MRPTRLPCTHKIASALARSLLVTCALLLTACGSGPRITFIPDGGSYTSEEVLERADEADTREASDLTAEEAPEARQRALATLRTRGESASEAADTITRVFPPDTASVPVLVEAARVDGRRVWLIVEAWGGREGPLDARRVWVVDSETDEVVSSATRR